ncbi:AMP-binding protein [Clostridiales bacterium COT073_COT-073]|nr:AMP-binding protein [Clostridiales bacterium COT073_COT-073]
MELINRTIQECFNQRIQETPQALAYHFGEVKYTWAETGNITFQLAKKLMAEGVRKGDRVGLLSVNSDAWLFYFFALQAIGAQTVLLNTALTDDEIIRNIELTEVNFLCYGKGYRRTFDELMNRLNLICMRKSYYGSIKMLEGMEYWQEMAGEYPVDFSIAEVSDQEICCFLFTSGTTKASKAVMLTHYNVINNARAIAEALRWQPADRMCVTVPFFHCFGLTACILTGLQTGFPLYVLAHYRTLQVCKILEQHQCTILNGVPSMFLAMRHNPIHQDYDLTSVRSGIIAGSPIFEQDYYDICRMFDSQMRLQPSYGQTESSPCITVADYDDDLKTKATGVGRPIEHVELRVIDPESGKICQTGERGMIETRGYHIMKGYYAMPQETAEALKDGWLVTGDIGYLDEDGYLHISGRRKNLIIRGGENIAPEEIEYYIRQIEGIDLVKVMGVPAVVLQEEIVACITTKSSKLTAEQITAELREHLAEYKIPRYIFFLNEIEKSASGKIDEKKLMKTILRKIKEES